MQNEDEVANNSCLSFAKLFEFTKFVDHVHAFNDDRG